MSLKLDAAIANTGTKFRVFPQPSFLPAFSQPETIRVCLRPRQVQPGPADDRMFVIDAIGKTPYNLDRPPYRGPANDPVPPGSGGHFDHLQPGTREFSAAHMYAVVRRVLDIWEDYFGRTIPWIFETSYPRLELIPLIYWDNAQSGFGFLEFGYGRSTSGGIDLARPYCENFDVLAHELGHTIIFSTVGVPASFATDTAEYGGHHEAGADLVAIAASLHFNSVVDHLLDHSRGNLFSVNELERVGELSESREIRMAFNNERMSSVSSEPHDLSQPLTGAIFDIFVEVYQRNLVERHLITQDLADRSFHDPNQGLDPAAIQTEFDVAYSGAEEGFKTALLEARDYWGQLLARTWDHPRLSPDNFAYAKLARLMLAVDQDLTSGKYRDTIRQAFAWREISLASNPIAASPFRFVGGTC